MSYTPQYKPAETSADGVNSSSLTTGPLWSGNVWTGAGEQNDYNYVGVNLQSQSGGTLTFEFSQNGTDWSKYPVTEFTVAAGINEVHGAWKGTRYVRPKFTADGIGTYFRIRTMYSYDPIILSAPLNQSIGNDSDANIVRAVSIGENPVGTYTNVKTDGVGFQTTDNLASGATFSSDTIDANGYTQVQTHIVCDNDGTLGFKFCSTANCTGITPGQNGVERYLSVPYLASGGFQLFSAPAFTPYVQYTFTNNGTGTTTQLFYETKLLTKGLSGQLLAMESFISPSMVANLGRNVIVGQNDAGRFNNIKTDTLNNLNVTVKNPRTAFGELKVAELTPEVQVNFVYGINTDIVSTGNTSGGTVTSSDSMAIVGSSASSNSWGEVNTIQSIKYAPGQGSVARFTCVFSSGVTGNTQFIGPIDSEDGFAFGYSGDTFGILRRQNSVDLFTPQTEWNIDRMDGSLGAFNPSAQLLDQTKGNVFEVKYQYLGFGAITFSIEDSSPTGDFVPIHVERYSNTATVPSIYSPNLPVTMRSENTTNTTNITMKSASMAGFVEGKRVLTGPIRSFSNSKGAGTPHTFSIRNATTFGGRTNKVRIYIQLISTTADGTQPVVVNLLRNASLSAPSWSGITNSPIETDISNSTISGGTSILSFGLSKVDSKLVQAQQDFVYEVNPGDIITVQTDGSTNAGWSATLSWREDI